MPAGTTRDPDDDDLSDSDPLLRNGATEGPPDSPLRSTAVKSLSGGVRFSIIVLTVALSFVFLIGVAYRRFGQAAYDGGSEVQSNHPNLTFISYENYTTFPLTPEQYRAECRKMHREMKHMAYWTDMMIDVPHSPALGVCKSTVTYMLGSQVGLMGELAVLAQVAALADSVSVWTS